MSNIKKSQRAPTNTEVYTIGIKVAKDIMTYVCENFGLINLRNDVILFSKNHVLSAYDKADLERIAKTYHLEVENDYIYHLADRFRDRIFDACLDFLWHIVEANTVYPNSTYEANLRKQYVWKCISNLEFILQLLQLILEMSPGQKDINKITVFVDEIQTEIVKLKNWKRTNTKLNRTARNNEAQQEAAYKIQVDLEVQKFIQSEIERRTKQLTEESLMYAMNNSYMQSCQRLCEIAYQYNPEFFRPQFYDEENNKMINPPIVFFPEDYPVSHLPDHTFDFMDRLSNPHYDIDKFVEQAK